MTTKTKTRREYDPKISAIHKLRVNIKSLAAEARIIRSEEKRAGLRYLWELSGHRRGRLRSEARYAQLALAFIRGRTYQSVEQKTLVPILAARLHEKIRRYSYRVEEKEVTTWLQK